MTQREVESWAAFYRLHPFDDLHRFHRPAALIASALGGDLQSRLEWLAPAPPDPALQHFSDADARTLAAFGVKPPTPKEH